MDESKLKRCSNHAEADEATDPLQNGKKIIEFLVLCYAIVLVVCDDTYSFNAFVTSAHVYFYVVRELDDSETEVNSLKKQKQEEETTEKKKECCFDTKDAKGNNERTIFVTGFDTSGSRDEIRSALTKHFSSCGELTGVFVPIECKTGLLVTMAKSRAEYYCHVDFTGCEICRAMFAAGRRRLYRWNLRTVGGKFTRFSPYFQEKCRLHQKETMASRKMEKSKTKEG
ncbi:hypothetical protein Bca52824_009207 [Brassica carinata]|uniref:RRM domain-containing protein n=1 Tax=Brassica carinata TaxID=52824 RepID=A0A8X7WBA0_BRACI|nr:hypothetical protein Bca52824_009207 [Brassica carinata]